MVDDLDDGEVVLLEIRNSQDTELKLFVEPWCYELELPIESSLRFTAIHPEPAKSMVTIEFYADLIVLWGVPKATMRLYADGKKVWECFEPYLPADEIAQEDAEPSEPNAD